MSQRDDQKLHEQAEALKRIVEVYPEYIEQAIADIQAGESLAELVSVLDSFY